MAKKEIVKVPEPEIDQSLVVADYGEDEGRGYEHQTAADATIPILNLLQGLSPQVADGKGIPGEWWNSSTEEGFGKSGILFVPATTRHVYVEWIPRTQGGGYVGQHQTDSEEVEAAKKAAQSFGKYMLPNGNQLVETFYVYGVISSEDGFATGMAVIPFTSTKIRSYKSWMTRLRQVVVTSGSRRIRPPLFANLSRITSVQTKNNKGTFAIPEIVSADPRGIIQSLLQPTDERFLLAKECLAMLDSGAAKVDFSKTDNSSSSEEDDLPF